MSHLATGSTLLKSVGPKQKQSVKRRAPTWLALPMLGKLLSQEVYRRMIMLGLEASDQQVLIQRLAGNGLTNHRFGALRIGTVVNQIGLMNYAFYSMAKHKPISGMMLPVLIHGYMAIYARQWQHQIHF